MNDSDKRDMKKKNRKLTRVAYRFLCYILGKTRYSALIGDFEELYMEIYNEKGRFSAVIWYWEQIFKSFPAFIIGIVTGNFSIFINYFKVTLRTLKRKKVYSFINWVYNGVTSHYQVLFMNVIFRNTTIRKPDRI